MLHHIAGDLNSPQNLYLPSILKSFSKIWEQVIITIIILILILITIITNHVAISSRKNLINGPMAALVIALIFTIMSK